MQKCISMFNEKIYQLQFCSVAKKTMRGSRDFQLYCLLLRKKVWVLAPHPAGVDNLKFVIS